MLYLSHQSHHRHGVQETHLHTLQLLKYAHQGGMNSPIVVIHGSHVDDIKDNYKRYLEGVFRKTFQLTGTPLRVQFNAGANPIAEPENKRKADEGIISMRRRKTAQRAELKSKKTKRIKSGKFCRLAQT